MPDYLPTISTSADPWIEVTTPVGTTYEQVQNSIGTYVYQVLSIYQRASIFAQILESLLLRKYDKFGNRAYRLMPMTPDPFQYQSAMNTDFRDMSYRIDANNNIYFNVKAGAIINMDIDVVELKMADALPQEDNFSQIEFLQDYDFQLD